MGNVRVSLLALGAFFLVSSAAFADSGPVDGCRNGSQDSSFWQRLADSYKAHLFPDETPAPASDPAAASQDPVGYRKDLPPSPVSNPPWPYSTYNVGGTPAIGYENMYYSALMDAIYCGSNGKA